MHMRENAGESGRAVAPAAAAVDEAVHLQACSRAEHSGLSNADEWRRYITVRGGGGGGRGGDFALCTARTLIAVSGGG
jgi:hypothetical protein